MRGVTEPKMPTKGSPCARQNDVFNWSGGLQSRTLPQELQRTLRMLALGMLYRYAGRSCKRATVDRRTNPPLELPTSPSRLSVFLTIRTINTSSKSPQLFSRFDTAICGIDGDPSRDGHPARL